ncbi:Integrase, catalytic core [Gossypium australe]|uniref:Integrase, catalytic core n=1 Tax=Gossypium australe TaxID=47621 RepID=A0A5B6V121_9ROSI|nr:Integrase, catalytic core [Gossypium australe]
MKSRSYDVKQFQWRCGHIELLSMVLQRQLIFHYCSTSTKLALSVKFDSDTLRTLELDALEERKHKAKKNLSVYQRRLSRAYDKLERWCYVLHMTSEKEHMLLILLQNEKDHIFFRKSIRTNFASC